MQESHNYHYAGKVEEFVAPVSGTYQLQCWGAAGGGYGGRGGYAEGTHNMLISGTIYVCVGGCARYYNNQIKSITSFYYGVLGGGATSITTTNRGELKNFESFKDEVLLVAGGGGGCEWIGKGGAGGGKTGQSGSTTAILPNGAGTAYSYGTGGTQIAGGTYSRGNFNATQVYPAGFGVGGIGAGDDGDRGEKNDFGAQGGGGWYGGGGSVYAGAAGGGSGHVNEDSSLLSNAKTTAGNEPFPSVDGKNNETGHAGNGACLITQTSF